MKVLGLDLSLMATGVCIIDNELIRTELIAQPRTKTVEDSIKRLISISDAIIRIINKEHPDHIIIEAPAMNQKWQAAAMGEIHGVIKTQIYLTTGEAPLVKQATAMRKVVVGKIERTMAPVLDKNGAVVVDKYGKVKKTASYGYIDGAIKGKKKKATAKDIIEAVLRSRGLNFPTQDEMDAYVAAKYCWDEMT